MNSMELQFQSDDVSSAGITYVGYSLPGSSINSPVWQIMKIDETGTPITSIGKYADGNELFDNVWANRTSLTYI